MNLTNPSNKHYLIVIFLTLITAVIIFKVQNVASLKNEKLLSFPLKICEWEGRILPMKDWVFESLETPYSILRNYYLSDRTEVNLAIVWYDDKEIAFHSAAACLGGSGNKVMNRPGFSGDLVN